MHLALAGLLVAGSAWLFFWDAAARPGELSRVHRQAASCPDCHRPWRGVSDGRCLQCHGFGRVNRLRPAVRFHQEERLCLRCHREHAGGAQPPAAMDHTVLSGGLECSLCHLDPHGATFGADCRQCHGLASWSVPGYRHPPAEERECHRCHPAPASHQGEHYREIILSFHLQNHPELRRAPARDCWRCHVTHDWRHLKMAGYRAPEE